MYVEIDRILREADLSIYFLRGDTFVYNNNRLVARENENNEKKRN